MKKIKVILSTFGPLHLIKSAEYLFPLVDITVIQGWVPVWWNKWILLIASEVVGRDLRKSFVKRMPLCLKGRNKSIGVAEFYLWGCRLLRVNKSLNLSNQAAYIYGKLSCKYIHGADIFHVRSGSGFGGSIEQAQKQGMKIVVDHSIAHPVFMDKQLRVEYMRHGITFDLGLDNSFWRNIIEECKKADCLLVNSQFVKETFIQNGFDKDKIEVVLQGVRKDFIGLKKDYSLKNNTLKILFTGGFNIRKGAEYILKALCELDKMDFNYDMTVVGDCRNTMFLYEKYLPKKIHFVSTVPQDELKEYLADSDVYLFPSLCEGCASSGMEAMAAGLPVIATKESGLPIENGIDGIIILAKNVEMIIDALIQIANDFKLRKQNGLKAKQKIEESFSWEMYAKKVHSLYMKLLE